jgi:quercetin dioxygenase-like cupin family protein
MPSRTLTIAFALALVASAAARAAEPARRVLFENARVRVVEVAFEPGDAEAEHTHPTDLLVVAVTAGGIDSTGKEGTTERLVPNAGDVHFYPKGSTHTARNPGQGRVVLRAVFLK